MVRFKWLHTDHSLVTVLPVWWLGRLSSHSVVISTGSEHVSEFVCHEINVNQEKFEQ